MTKAGNAYSQVRPRNVPYQDQTRCRCLGWNCVSDRTEQNGADEEHPTNTVVRPVLPPSLMPAAPSMYKVLPLEWQKPPNMAPSPHSP